MFTMASPETQSPPPGESHFIKKMSNFLAQPIVWAMVVVFTLASISAYKCQDVFDSRTWYRCHEDIRYHVSATHFYDAVSNGVWYPRWLPDFNGGYGYPTYVFYQPGYYFMLTPVIWITGAVGVAIPCLTFLLLLQGGIGAYFLSRVFANRTTSLFAAVMFIATPYLYINLYVRGDLGEMAAMLMAPWSAWALIRMREHMTASPWILTGWVLRSAICLGIIFITHPVTSLFLLPTLSLWILWQTYVSNDLFKIKYLAHCSAGIAIAIAMSGIHWMFAMTMKKYVDYEHGISGYFRASDHVLWPQQLLSFFWDYGISVPGPNDGMPFTLGLPHFLAATAGMVLSFRRAAVSAAFVIYVGLLFLMLHYCSWIWSHVPFLAFVQFPWRVLSVVALFQLLCIIGFSRYEKKPAFNFVLIAVAVLTLAAHSYMRASKAERIPIDAGVGLFNARMMYVPGFTANLTSPFTPRTENAASIKKGRGSRAMVDDPAFEVKFLPGNSKYHIHCSLRRIGNAPCVELNQVYFQGWRVILDGTSVDDNELRESCAPDGILKVRIPVDAGEHVIEAWYDGPPGWRTYAVSSLAFCLAVLLSLRVIPFKTAFTPNATGSL